MSDFSGTYRWSAETLDWIDVDEAELNDRALEQWLGAPPQRYVPTFALSDGTVPAYIAGGIGRWERQRGQFVIASFSASVTATVAGTGKLLGVSMPTAPAAVTPAVGGVWVFPAGGQAVIAGPGVGAGSAFGAFPFNIVIGTTYYAGLGADGGTAGALIAGLIVYRERI